jgi:YD repeat-containing protein
MTLINGPRRDTTVTRIWTDRYGAPTVIRDALGAETRLFREDARFPALVTEVRAPNGLTTRAVFDDRGNGIRTTQVNPYGDGRNAVATYEYADTLNPFLPTRIIQPEGDWVKYVYLANGNLNYLEDGRGSPSRVSFTYRTDACAGLPATVTEPGTPASPFAYDARCNLKERKTPLGFVTTIKRNEIGQVDSIYTPIDATRREIQTFIYDAMGRVKTSKRVGPEMGVTITTVSGNFLGAQTLTVASVYDAEGNLLSTEPSGGDRQSWTYDALGRVARTRTDLWLGASYGATLSDSTVYDAVGNPVEIRHGGPPQVTLQYDALNRLIKRIEIPMTRPGEQWCYGNCEIGRAHV